MRSSKYNKILLSFLLVSLIIIFPVAGYNIPITNKIYKIIVTIFIILPVIIFYYLLNIWNKRKDINFLTAIIIFIVILYITNKLTINNENQYLRQGNTITYSIVINKGGIKMPPWIEYKYYVNNIEYIKSANIPLKSILPRRLAVNMSVGDTVLIRYSVEKPEISRIYKFKPTSEEIRKYIERDTVTIKDTIMIDNNFEEKSGNISYYYKLSDGDKYHFIKWHEITKEGIEIVFDFTNKTVLETASKTISNSITNYINENYQKDVSKDSEEMNENYEEK